MSIYQDPGAPAAPTPFPPAAPPAAEQPPAPPAEPAAPPAAPAAPPAGEQPAVPAAPAAPAAPPAGEEWKLHPSWEQPLAAIPDPLRRPIYEKIREDERRVQTEIENARGSGIDPSWRDFVGEAAKAGIQPEALRNAYNGAIEIARDPLAFTNLLLDSINDRVAKGEITIPQGYQLRAQGLATIQQAQAAVAAGDVSQVPDELLTDEQKEIRDLKAWRETETARQKQEREAREAQADEQRAAQFMQSLETKTKGAPEAIVQIIGRAASDLYSAQEGRMTLDQAIDATIASYTAAGGVLVAAPAPTPTPPPPVTTTPGSPAPTPPPKVDTTTVAGREAQRQAMIAAANAVVANG